MKKITFVQLYDYFQSKANQDLNAKVIFQMLSAGKFILTTTFLSDILGELNTICSILQKDGISVQTVALHLISLSDSIKAQYINPLTL